MIQQYPKLMYVDISSNSIQSLDILSNLPMLVQLNASSNEIDECLTFNPPYCNDDNRWSTGHDACGSMLTLANLNSNKITKIKDLSNHSFLECLLLSKNMIRSITGLEKLQYLQVLDISYNQITKIEGLNNLNIQELNLEGNYIETLEGLSTLNRLTSLNVASNMITCIAPLSASNSLRNLNLKNNKVFTIRQIEFLSELPWLQYLEMHGNPCCCKQNFRARVIFRLSKLLKLDRTIVSAEEKVRSYNLYETDLGDLRGRTEIFQKYLPNQEFKLYTPTFFDDEMELSINDLLNEYDKEYDLEKKQNKIEILSNYSKSMYSDVLSQALSRSDSPQPM
jgi:internalin A